MQVRRITVPDGAGRITLSYTEWGAAHAPVVVCVHGLTRNGRDFDALAEALAPTRRVLCPDIAGRGLSDWLSDPQRYVAPTYVAHLSAFLSILGVGHADWVGTSMGGLIGMAMAARPNTPIRRLVLNDIGPFLPKSALQRIVGYVGLAPPFATRKDLEAYLRTTHAAFGPLSDAQWAHLAAHGGRRTDDGHWELVYDPNIREPFAAMAATDVDLWPLFDTVRCRTLCLRGAESLVLTRQTAHAMTRRGPHVRLVEFAGIGHAPALMADDQVETVRSFLCDD